MTISGRISSLLSDRWVKGLILSAILIVLISFFRAISAGSICVDTFGLSGLPVIIVFTGFVTGLVGFSYCYYQLWQEGRHDLESVRLLSVALALIFSPMLPMLSNDIYSLLTYGDAANKGVDVYTDVHSLHVSPFYFAVSYIWKTAPCVYGPISLGTSRLAAALANGHLIAAIVAFKVLIFIWAIVFIEICYRTARLFDLGVRPYLFIVLNPVFLIQGLAQLHCDIIAISLASCMLYFFLARRWYWAFLFAGLCVVAKMNFILMLPFLVVGLFLQKTDWRSLMMQVVVGVAISIMVVGGLYYHYYTSPDTFTVPFNFLFKQNPAKSISEVLGDVIYFAPSVISGHNDEVQSSINAGSGIGDRQLEVWIMVKKICQLFPLLMSAWVFIRFWLGQRDMKQWMPVFLRLLLLFLLFYSHVFYAWYLMILLPFVWYDRDLRFMQWMFVLTCFSNIHDIMCAVNHGTPVYFLVLPLTFFSVLVFFWRFRNNFFGSLRSA